MKLVTFSTTACNVLLWVLLIFGVLLGVDEGAWLAKLADQAAQLKASPPPLSPSQAWSLLVLPALFLAFWANQEPFLRAHPKRLYWSGCAIAIFTGLCAAAWGSISVIKEIIIIMGSIISGALISIAYADARAAFMSKKPEDSSSAAKNPILQNKVTSRGCPFDCMQHQARQHVVGLVGVVCPYHEAHGRYCRWPQHVRPGHPLWASRASVSRRERPW